MLPLFDFAKHSFRKAATTTDAWSPPK